MVQFKVIINIV